MKKISLRDKTAPANPLRHVLPLQSAAPMPHFDRKCPPPASPKPEAPVMNGNSPVLPPRPPAEAKGTINIKLGKLRLMVVYVCVEIEENVYFSI
ncbi:hypothetical protein M8J75_004979 [Diaphorina citri]|nr:hypothetical protein M8J75_004979 [Diaphorina citri]